MVSHSSTLKRHFAGLSDVDKGDKSAADALLAALVNSLPCPHRSPSDQRSMQASYQNSCNTQNLDNEEHVVTDDGCLDVSYYCVPYVLALVHS